VPERIRKAYALNPPKRHKYNARRVQGYASAREAKRAAELKLMEKAGKITNLQEQVPFTLLPAAKEWGYPRPLVYIADFVYRDENGREIVEDVKGFATPVWRIKQRLMSQILGIIVKEF